MKLQNMAVIFAIIIIPITLILSSYIGIQIDTASLKQEYDTKLLDATHDAVVAFQLNSVKNVYSTNADSLRRDIKASVNAFFTSLATNLGVPGENANYVSQYIPAIVFTLYDGYYIYSPIEVEYEDNGVTKTRYEHALKPYIHYSVRYQTGNCDIVVNYSLDNYITIYGYMKGQYISRGGYLIAGDVADDGSQYRGVTITDNDAKEYYKSAKEFTKWIKNESFTGTKIVDVVQPRYALDEYGKGYPQFTNDDTKILDIKDSNDPEEKVESAFTAHKREIMKQSIQSNLNNAICTYSDHTTLNIGFRMPVLTEQDWDKILSNVNVISFMQGLPVGIDQYNNYTIITSTENKQYVDPDLIYYIYNAEYHKLGCPKLENATETIIGYRSIEYDKQKRYNEDKKEDEYYYKELIPGKIPTACYTCIVDSSNLEKKKIKDYSDNIEQAYYNTIARERWNLNKLNVTND